jgi:primosomal protein N' (replication factor Y)
MTTPLKLKSERVGRAKIATREPYLSVLVDTGVFHLDQEFEYSLPEKLDLNPGQWVSVPFHGKNCLGLIVRRSSTASVAKVLPINRAAKGPIVSNKHLQFYQAVAARWAVPIFDVLRFVTRFKDAVITEVKESSSGKRAYLQLPPDKSEIEAIRTLAKEFAAKGATLVIVPEARLATAIASDEYEVMMRGGALTPKTYQQVIVVREDSEHHYEIKSPGFNTRDVALLRSEFLGENLLFLGYSPSLEMAKLIEQGYVTYKKSAGKVNLKAAPTLQGELLPSKLVKELRPELGKGRTLFVAPSKGYGLAISCANCRNLAKCNCGGKLTKLTKTASPICTICAKEYSQWRCAFCKSERIYLLGRGIERIAEDLGKSFPNHAIHIATADKQIEGEISEKSIVISTVGAVPDLKFATVIFLDGLNLGADMRSEERYLSTIFRYSTYASRQVLIVERPENPAVSALLRWSPLPILRRQLADLESVKLPPFARHLLIKSDESERLYTGFLSALRDGRIPRGSEIHNLGNGVISIFFTLKDAKSLLSFIFEFQKRRSISGKKPLKLRIDPYLLG